MIRILRFIIFVCFIQVYCEDDFTAAPSISEHNNKTDEDIPISIKQLSEIFDKSQEATQKIYHVIRTRRAAGNRSENDDESETFPPDTILVNTKKVYESNAHKISNRINVNDESLISMDEALKMRKLEPVKPIKYDDNLPAPINNAKLPPHGYLDKDSDINLETRKLFIRPANFPTTTESSVEKTKIINKTVKKDLSQTIGSSNNF